MCGNRPLLGGAEVEQAFKLVKHLFLLIFNICFYSLSTGIDQHRHLVDYRKEVQLKVRAGRAVQLKVCLLVAEVDTQICYA